MGKLSRKIQKSFLYLMRVLPLWFTQADYSLNKQGVDVGKKYRTGLYSTDPRHLEEARAFINGREDRYKIMLEVLPLTNYVRSAEEHQHHLERHPEDCSCCHIPDAVLNRYRNQ